MQERVFMGIGNKPFMDIQPSDAAISDRAINYVLLGRGKKILPLTQVYLVIILILVSRYYDNFLLLFDFSQLSTLPLIKLALAWFLQKTRCCPLQDHVVHRTGFLEGGQNLLVQGAVRLPPLPPEGVPCPLWDTCVGQSEGWFRGAQEGTYRLLELWRRTTWTMRVGVRTYCVSFSVYNQTKMFLPYT